MLMKVWDSAWVCLGVVLLVANASAQQPAADSPNPPPPQVKQNNPDQNGQKHKPSSNHIFWVIPNYREDEGRIFRPLTPGAKFKVAFQDSFDPSAFLVAGVFAGSSVLQGQYSFHDDGVSEFAKYYGGAFADQAIGNFMTEGLFPTFLKQDPRYFYLGKGHGFWDRTWYALNREVITKGDNGHAQLNVSELAGNLVAAGISNAYYPAADRSFSNTASKWGQQIALDAAFNVMKEFWPDVRDKLFKPAATAPAPVPAH
ncbi:MAG TPA: hypothetical protein VKW78_11205 [Terriglobales bacterium]|nr:hypothetical protein [Terriglobales bacterium]